MKAIALSDSFEMLSVAGTREYIHCQILRGTNGHSLSPLIFSNKVYYPHFARNPEASKRKSIFSWTYSLLGVELNLDPRLDPQLHNLLPNDFLNLK